MVRRGKSRARCIKFSPKMRKKQKVPTVVETLNKAADYLGERGLENPRLNAELLLEHVMGLRRIDLYLNHQLPLQGDELSTFRALVESRLAGYPLQYLTGETEFFSLRFQASSAALIPRPETEILVEAVLKRLGPLTPPLKVADLGTGSGIIAIALAVHLPEASLWATDRSPEALDLARRNAHRHGVQDRIRFFQGDLFNPLRGLEGTFSAVVSNPPYVSSGQLTDLPAEIRLHEPLMALDGGQDGLMVLRRVVDEASQFLSSGGILALEVGAGQAAAVANLMAKAGSLGDLQTIEDYAGVERVVLAEKRPDG